MEWIQGKLPEIIKKFETAKEEFSQIHAETDWPNIEKMEIKLKKNLTDLEGLQRLANLFQILKKDEITDQIGKQIEEFQAFIDICHDAYKTALRTQGYMR